MKEKHVVLSIALLVFCATLAFAQGNKDVQKKSEGPIPVELWYHATTSEVGPLPTNWTGYDIIREKFNIELTTSALPSSLTDRDMKIQAASAADVLPDIFVASREVWVRLVENGMVADVTDMYDLMPERTKIMWDDAARAFTTINGKSYGFATPSAVDKNEGLLIRKDWLDKLGLEIPKTTDELLDVMRAFTFKDPDGNGKNDTWGFGAFIELWSYEAYPGRRLEPLMGAFGVDGTWDIRKESAGLQILKPEFYDYMVYMKKIIDEGVIDPNWLSYKKDDFRAAWKQGKFGIMREQNSALASKSNYAPFDANFPDGEWIVIDPPVGPKGYSSVGPQTSALRIWAVNQKSADEGKLEAIAQMLEWMGTGEGYYLCGWGIEGVNYVLDEDGIPVSTGGDMGFDGPIGQTYIQLRSLVFNYKTDVELQSRYPAYITDVSKKQMSALDVLREMQTKKWVNAMGSDSFPVPSTDLKTFYEQGLAEFFTGKRVLNQNNWTSWINDLKKLGADAWEKEGLEYGKANGLIY